MLILALLNTTAAESPMGVGIPDKDGDPTTETGTETKRITIDVIVAALPPTESTPDGF